MERSGHKFGDVLKCAVREVLLSNDHLNSTQKMEMGVLMRRNRRKKLGAVRDAREP